MNDETEAYHLGDIEVNSCFGSMLIFPKCGNEIVIKQKSDLSIKKYHFCLLVLKMFIHLRCSNYHRTHKIFANLLAKGIR